MNRKIAIAIFSTFLLTGPINGQQIFYDSKRDKQAQDAVTAAKDVSAGGLFEKMQNNAARQFGLEAGALADWQRIVGQGMFDTVKTWSATGETVPGAGQSPANARTGCTARFLETAASTANCKSLRCKLADLRVRLNVKTDDSGLAAQMSKLEEQVKFLKADIQALQDAAKQAQDDSILAIATQQIDTVSQLLGYAKQVESSGLIGKVAAIGEIAAAVDQIKGYVAIVKGIFDGYNALKPDPRDLLALHQLLDLALLKVEVDRLNQLSQVYARMRLDGARVLRAVNRAEQFLGAELNSTAEIDKTLSDLAAAAKSDAAKMKQLNQLLAGLHFAARAFAEADLAVNLCSVREGALERASEIRRTGAQVNARQAAASEGLQRLALYYKSGIKPSELVNLLFTIAGAAALPVNIGK